MITLSRLSCSLISSIAIWLLGTIVQSAEPNAQCQNLAEPKPLLALVEHCAAANLRGTPVRFVLYSNRTVIYQDRSSQHEGFVTGTVDDEAWQSFEKILAGLPELKINFEINKFDIKSNSLIVFNDGKRLRHIAMSSPAIATKTGSGKLASYEIAAPSIQSGSPLFGSVEVPQSATGAWYEMHNFVPKDAHPWIPNNFDVMLVPCAGNKSVSWPASWPQLKEAESNDFGGYYLQMPGLYLSQFQRLFNQPLMSTSISGQTLLVACTVSLPCQELLLSATPMGFNYEAPKRLPLLPHDFLEKTNLADVKKIARERNYDMERIVSAEPGSLESYDIIEVLCESGELDTIDAGLELTLEAQRDALHRASMIASTHKPEVTKALIIRHIADRKYLEIITPLIQESVVRGACYDDVKPISEYWKTLCSNGEPLAWLPLHRMDIEELVDFPRYRGGTRTVSFLSSSVNGKLEKQPASSPTGKPFTAVPLLFDEVAAARCVRSWTEHSNGKFEAKLFQTSSPISAADVSDTQLSNLELECLADATPHEFKVDVVTTDRLFALLFSAASCGGAYDDGELGAYGRLATWKSLAALVGLADSASFDDVSGAVKQSDWCSIQSTAKWFYDVAWDFGIVCVRPDRRHIAVLAASDED